MTDLDDIFGEPDGNGFRVPYEYLVGSNTNGSKVHLVVAEPYNRTALCGMNVTATMSGTSLRPNGRAHLCKDCQRLAMPTKATSAPSDHTAVDAPVVVYDREVLINVVVYHHQRENGSGCHCGWSVLGASHASHVADVYEASVAASA